MFDRARSIRRLLAPALLVPTLALAPGLVGQDTISARAETPAATVRADSPAPAGDTPVARPAPAADSSPRARGETRGDGDPAEEHRDDEFPGPLWLALLLVALFGMLGAFAGDLVADAFRIDWVRRDADGVNLGFVGRLVVGAVAALITLNVNPPEGWVTLIGTALAAGVAGEAILKAVAESRRADREETMRENAEVEAARGTQAAAVAGEQLALAEGHLRRIHTLARAGSGVGQEKAHAALHDDDAGRAGSGGLAAEVEAYAGQALDELREHSPLFATVVTVTAEIRAILRRRLNRDQVDELPLKDMGGDDAGVRRGIARDIALRWTRLRPPFTAADVAAADTLSSLAHKVNERFV